MKQLFIFMFSLLLLAACQNQQKQTATSPIDPETTQEVISRLLETHGPQQQFRIERGVQQAAVLWRESDGTSQDFEDFCVRYFIADSQELDMVFDRLEHYFEHLYGYMGSISLELNRQIHEDRGPIHPIDQMFGSYSPSANLQDDFFNNKIAFTIVLNFPSYTLEEKNERGGHWDGRQWGYARLGDFFTTRIPAHILQENNKVYSEGRLYISEYNIFAGQLLNQQGEKLFPQGMKLLSHWNLRDEIKANYGSEQGLPKQEMIYQVMLRIISQDIPREVINNDDYQWDPYANQVSQDGEPVESHPEAVTRYEHLLANFQSMKRLDPFYPNQDTYIKRRFENSMEIPLEQVEALFREYASSPLLREVGQLISQRLGRELRPFDIWYNGFVGRAGISESELDGITKNRYPRAAAFDNDMPRILRELGFDHQMAEFLGSKIEVDAARGSGHAMGASMPSMPSHLRTRIAADGMDYKGYNIAVHEFGHNVEQTISQHMVDNNFIAGVPNTGFTEALAFMFQKRDMQLLGIDQEDPMMAHLEVLDIFWDNYEMMGVSLVDMQVWQWMYDNPQATALELKEAVIDIAKEVWNEYYADIFNARDIPLLAVYSHMIQSPLYLMNYPYGRLIMFQLEDHIAGKDFASEVMRLFALGQLTPRHWMQQATGSQISNQPLFNAVEEATQALGS